MESSKEESDSSPSQEKRQTDDQNGPNPRDDLNEAAPKEPGPKRPIYLRARDLWVAKTGITWPLYKQMLKGALCPTIATACFQATAWANFYTTLGYLVAVGSIVSFAIMPRAKFIQTMFCTALLTCFGAAMSLLAFFCVIKAREHTEVQVGDGPTSGLAGGHVYTVPYNSSASAVAAIWLVVQIFLISSLRAARPQFTVPCIMWAIFTNVGMVYAPQFADMSAAESFCQHLLLALLTGFGIGTGVSLFIFPLTSRALVRKEMVGYAQALRNALNTKMAYLRSLETIDMFAAQRIDTAGEKHPSSPEAEAVKAQTKALAAAHAKLATDLPFAKREVALGKLGPDDYQKIFRMLRMIMVPIIGLNQLSDIFHRMAVNRGWTTTVDRTGSVAEDSEQAERDRLATIQQYHDLMQAVLEPFAQIVRVTNDGIQHAMIQLQLIPKPKAADNEARGDEPVPGDRNFAMFFNRNVQDFVDSKILLLKRWAELHGIELADDFFEHPSTAEFSGPAWMEQEFDSDERGRYRRQLYVCLYMEFLLWSIARRALDLVNYADEMKASGKLDKTRLVVPGYKRTRKWIRSAIRDVEDSHEDDNMGANDNTMNVHLGEALRRRRDPAHLPPTNAWERVSNRLRIVAHFFASPPAAFGFRVCCATMSIAIVNYLRDTQTFYTRERIFWAQIMITIGMQPSAGQGLRNFIFRIGGTAASVIASWIAWYIVDGHAAGVIVFMFLFLHIPVYIILTKPQWMTLGMVGQITMVIVCGYELQVQKIGKAVATSNGQLYLPIYELGAYRLATVSGGLFLAWIWTIFPYPISEHKQIQQKLGAALYLLANFYSIMHETVNIRLRGEEGDLQDKESPGRRLEKVRLKVFNKATMVLQGLRAQCAFVKYDIPMGGRFPQALYEATAANAQSVMSGMQLVSYASTAFSEMQDLKNGGDDYVWMNDFRRLVTEAGVTSQAITTLLTLLSSSITTGQPLPPYIRIPEPYLLSKRLDELDHDILSVRHIAEPGYASFAVLQLGTRTIIDDLKKLLENIKELVGELDFSYHIISTGDAGQSEETLTFTSTHQDLAGNEKSKHD